MRNRVIIGALSITLLAAVLAGALLGFLRYNFCPASIFLGDSGSLLLGYVLSVLSIQGQQKGPTVVVLLVPILVLGFPIVETLVTVARRYGRGGTAGLFDADRVGVEAMGVNPAWPGYLQYCCDAGLGQYDLAKIDVHGPEIASVRKEYRLNGDVDRQLTWRDPLDLQDGSWIGPRGRRSDR